MWRGPGGAGELQPVKLFQGEGVRGVGITDVSLPAVFTLLCGRSQARRDEDGRDSQLHQGSTDG